MKLHLEDLEVWTRIGVPEQERAQPQKLLVSLAFSITPPLEDNLQKTVDYALLAEKVRQFSEIHSFQLIEIFIQKLALFLQEAFSLSHLDLTVKKFILPHCKWVAVTYQLPRED